MNDFIPIQKHTMWVQLSKFWVQIFFQSLEVYYALKLASVELPELIIAFALKVNFFFLKRHFLLKQLAQNFLGFCFLD